MISGLERRVERPGLLEGPRFEAVGGILFSDVMGGGVHRLRPDGEVVTVLERRRGIGGLIAHRDGGVVVTGRSVVHGDRELLAGGEGITGFNDLTTDAEGRVLVGALRYRPMAGEEAVPGEVWRISAPGQAEVVAEGVLWVNGIGLSPDGERMYVSDYARKAVLVFPGGDVFAEAPRGESDGLAVDAEGGVWVALGSAGAVARFTPGGEVDAVVDVEADFVSSLSFGGEDGRDVAITAIGGLFTGRSEVAGAPVAPATP